MTDRTLLMSLMEEQGVAGTLAAHIEALLIDFARYDSQLKGLAGSLAARSKTLEKNPRDPFNARQIDGCLRAFTETQALLLNREVCIRNILLVTTFEQLPAESRRLIVEAIR